MALYDEKKAQRGKKPSLGSVCNNNAMMKNIFSRLHALHKRIMQFL
jgi:hypothetical protein